MKTILYFLIAIFVFGIIAASIPHRANGKNTVLLQSIDRQVSPVSLAQSAKIISERLKSLSSETFDVTIVPEKNQISVKFSDKWNVPVVENLLIQKGSLAFYETYDDEGLSALLQDSHQLYSLFKNDGGNQQGAKLGCATAREFDKINDFVKSIPVDQKCLFAWGQWQENKEICLYALRVGEGGKPVLTGADVEHIAYSQAEPTGNYQMEFDFKKESVALWAGVTKRNINKTIAIVLDNRVIHAPVVRDEMDSGKCIITGNFSEAQVAYFTALGNCGELPLSFKVVK